MSDPSTVSTTTADTQTKPQSRNKPRTLPPYHVVLLDDDHHTYEYVIIMLCRLFGCTPEKAYMLACEVDANGRVIVDTTTKERAELKQEQIHSYGRDPLIPACAGSMSAVIEPAPQ